jgi:hypothetical protein
MKRTQLFLIVRWPSSRRPASVAHIRQCLKDERSTTWAYMRTEVCNSNPPPPGPYGKFSKNLLIKMQ